MEEVTEKECCYCGIVKPLDDFNKMKKGKHGHNPRCKLCRFETRGEERKQTARIQMRRRQILADEINSIKSAMGCRECGEKRHYVLDWHHRNPGDKEGTVSGFVRDLKRDEALNEIPKCSVLCANCHRAHHWLERQ